MPTETNQNNPLMLDRMKGENETLGAAVMALFITLLMKALDLNKDAQKKTRRANGFNAKDAMGILDAGRYAVVMDIGLNKKATLDDRRWTLNELGAGRFSIIDNNGQPRTLTVGESAAIDKVLMTTGGQKALNCMVALRRAHNMSQASWDAVRRQLATDTQEIEEGYAPATKAHMDAFGLDEGDVVRYVSLEGTHIMNGTYDTKQLVQQYATRDHLNLNAGGAVNWLNKCVTANGYYCGVCTKAGERGYFPSHYPAGAVKQRNPRKGTPLVGPHPSGGKAVPVNWSSPAVLDDKVSAQVAASWNIPEEKTGRFRCPTCSTPKGLLSHNGNMAHLPLLSFTGNEAGLKATDTRTEKHTDDNGVTVETTEMGAIRAVGFRMGKPAFLAVQGILNDTTTPVDAMAALMNDHGIRYRDNTGGKTVWRPARLVPVWFHYPTKDGSHTDRLGLALEPIAHAGGHGDLNG